MEEENNSIIKKAFYAIKESIDTSILSDNEKNALKILIDKLVIYYDKKVSLIKKSRISINSSERIAILDSFMTDVLVDINTVIRGESDVYYFVSVVNKKLNDKELERLIKIKKK